MDKQIDFLKIVLYFPSIIQDVVIQQCQKLKFKNNMLVNYLEKISQKHNNCFCYSI